MEYCKFNDSYKEGVYQLFADFQKEDNFYKELSFEEYDERVFKNRGFRYEGSFVCLDKGEVVGFASAQVRTGDEENENASVYIHTFIVKKEYRRQGIGSHLMDLVEGYAKEQGKKSLRCVFISQISYPWYIPHTNKHMHPGCPGVIINSEYYIFLYHHGFFVNSIHEGFHVDLTKYEMPQRIKDKMKENEKDGLFVELYDPNKHFGVEEFCNKIHNEGFAYSIRYNLKREKPYPFICANLNGKMVGWTGSIYTEPTKRGHLDGICVDPDLNGRGLGTSIFAKLCQANKDGGAEYMTLFTGIDNVARYIYLGAGFNVAQSFADMKKNFK